MPGWFSSTTCPTQSTATSTMSSVKKCSHCWKVEYGNFHLNVILKKINITNPGCYPARLKKVLIVTAPLWFKAPFKVGNIIFILAKIYFSIDPNIFSFSSTFLFMPIFLHYLQSQSIIFQISPFIPNSLRCVHERKNLDKCFYKKSDAAKLVQNWVCQLP